MNSEKPLISIIIPVYNVEKYLPQCLDSLVGQTLQQIEIICIDDCSPDNSITILSRYAKKDRRIKVISLPENRRQGGARNIGIREAKADYIGFVDSDDWIESSMYEKLYAVAQQTHADIVSPLWYFSAYGEQSIKTPNGVSLKGLSTIERNKTILLNGFRFWTSIFKKELFDKNDLFFPEHKLFEDNAIVSAIHLSAHNIVQIPDCFYYYRCNNISSADRCFNNHHFFDRMDTSLQYLNNMKKLGFYQLYKEEIDFGFINLFYRATLIGCFTRFSIPERSYMQKIMNLMQVLMPDYRKNKYYQEISLKHRTLLSLCEINIPLAIAAYKAVKLIRRNRMEKFK